MAVAAARAKTLFLAASDLADPAERAAFLDRECGGDAELRARVEALLRANDAAPLPAAPEATVDPANRQAETEEYGDPTARVGAILAGKYKLVEEIGAGGMGSVFMALQTEPVRRAVAVKVIKAGMDSKAVLARFEAERQALAMMDHPNIAKVLDAGTTDGGRPFFVMELVKGVPITRYCDDHKLTPRQRLELFVPVCQAIQHAHQKGIIHRDIKPSNVLVALYDDRPVPKVIDFGVAKAAGQPLTDKTLMTGFGAIVGTPEYMSPEQASLNNLDIDTRSDVYSLGVLLYELLTGTTPVDRNSLGQAALLEILRIVREVEAPRPSAKLSSIDTLPSVAANRGTEPARLSRLMKGELDWLVMKALEKDRTRRYDTANGLARDIQRYLADEVVEARPPSVGYRVSKFVRRHKGQVLAASLVLLALAGGIVGTTLGLFEARRQEQLAREETGKKEKALVAEAERVQERDAALEDALKQKKAADDAKDDALKQKKAAEWAAEERRRQLANSQVMLANAAWRDGNVWSAKDRLDEVPADLRRWEWRYLKQTSSGSLFTLYGHAGTVSSVAFSPDGARLASGSGDMTVKVWDARTGQELLTLKGHKGEVTSVAFSPDGTRLVSGSGNPNNRDSAGEVKVWAARTGRELLTVKDHTGGVTSVAFSPDGARLASASYQTVKVWDARTGQELHTLKGHTQAVRTVAFSPDGARLASGSGDFPHRGKPGEVKVWDARTGQELHTLRGHTDVVWSVAFSPDGTRLASGSTDGTVMMFDPRIGRELYTLKGHAGPVFSVAFSPEGVHLASASYDCTVKVWDARTGQQLHTLKGHSHVVLNVAFSPDGARLASASHDQTVKFWDARTGQELHTLKGHTDMVNSVAFSPDGARLASASYDSTVKVWDARTGQELQILKGHTGWASSVAFRPDGARLASGSQDGTVKVWDGRTGQELQTLKGHSSTVTSVAFSSDGALLASGSVIWDAQKQKNLCGEVKVWDARSGQELQTLKGHTSTVTSVAFSPKGALLASGSQDGTVKVWDARSGQELQSLKGHTGWASSVAFSPDGARLASASHDQMVKVWDARTGQELHTLKGHANQVNSVAFSPDGVRLVSASADWTVKVWDAGTGQELQTLKGYTSNVRSVTFSPDGARLGSGCQDGTVKVWDARSGQELHTLKGHTNWVTSVAFSHDSQRVVSRDDQGKTIVWDLTNGQRLNEPVPQALVWGSARSPDGRLFAWIDRDTIRLIGPPDAEELLVRRAQTQLDAAWHRDEADRWEKDKQWQMAVFHLEQALRAQPGDGNLGCRLTAALAQAAEINRTLTNAATWRRLALAHLHTGQVDAYRRTAQQMQERFAVAGEAKQAAFLLAGTPGFGLAGNRLALTDSAFGCGLFQWQQTIRTAVVQPGVLPNPQTWLARLPKDDKLLRGAILCRSGEPIAALAELSELREPVGLLFRALAEQGRGNQGAARTALAEAKKLMPPDNLDLIEQTPLPWLEMVETRVLVKELETLLRSN